MTQANDPSTGRIPSRTPEPHPADVDALKRFVEKQYSVKAEYAYTVPVRHLLGTLVWEGPVYVFSLMDHPTAKRAFGWSTTNGLRENQHVALESRAVPEAAEAVRLALTRPAQ
jgi:hypothetical protein